MSKICIVTGKRVLFGNNVSHSNMKIRRRFCVNFHKHKFWVPGEKRFVKLLISIKGLRFINKFGISKVLYNIRQRGIKV